MSFMKEFPQHSVGLSRFSGQVKEKANHFSWLLASFYGTTAVLIQSGVGASMVASLGLKTPLKPQTFSENLLVAWFYFCILCPNTPCLPLQITISTRDCVHLVCAISTGYIMYRTEKKKRVIIHLAVVPKCQCSVRWDTTSGLLQSPD